MARKPRLHFPGAWYHVVLRGNAGQQIFFKSQDYYHFYLLLQEGVERYRHQIHAFCCMADHVHLAIQVADVPLSRIIQNLSFRYTRWVNHRLGRQGHLFQGRYQAVLIEADIYLLELVRYIHLNPVRTGLVHRPEAYPWSGHRAYLGEEELPWLSVGCVLCGFSQHMASARQAYRAFVEAGRSEGHRRDFHYGTRGGRLLGDDTFIREALEKAKESTSPELSLDTVIARVCEAYALREEDLQANGKQRRPAQARATVAWLVREHPRLTLAELSRRMNRDIATLSAAIERLLTRSETDPVLARWLEVLKEELLRCSGDQQTCDFPQNPLSSKQ